MIAERFIAFPLLGYAVNPANMLMIRKCYICGRTAQSKVSVGRQTVFLCSDVCRRKRLLARRKLYRRQKYEDNLPK